MRVVLNALAAFVCALILWEALLESVIARNPGAVDDPVQGGIFANSVIVHSDEGYAVVRYNSLGMRHAEIGPKAPGEFRVLVLGDSYTEARQVGDAETFCDQLQQRLQGATRHPVQVINAGRSGGAPAYYIHLADFYKQRIQPDYVVVQLNQGDFDDDLFDHEKFFYLEPDGPSFKTVKSATFVSANPVTQRFRRFGALKRLSTLRLLTERLPRMLHGGKAPVGENEGGPSGGMTARMKGIDYEAAVDWTVRELRERYPNLVLLYLPTLDYDHLDAPRPRAERALQASADRNGVPLLDMRADFIAAYLATRQPAHGFNNTRPGFGHINGRGHALVARQLTRFFTDRLPR